MPTRADVVHHAAKYVGYEPGFDTANTFTKYLGHSHEAWCADFVTAIYAMTGLPLPSMQVGARMGYSYVPSAWAYAKQHKLAKSSWQAEPGDIVCFDWTGAGTCQSNHTHTGIVESWASGTLHTIEGNSSPGGGVWRHNWPAASGAGNPQIAGVIDASKLVDFSDRPSPHPHPDPDVVPAFPGRVLMLKTPHMRGPDVHEWQAQMAHRGWHLEVNGSYDVGTRDVCVAFQKQKGLGVDGEVGPRTWAAAWSDPVTPE